MSRFSEKAKLIAAAVFGGVVVVSGVATAATGSLPLVSHSHSHPTPATSHTPDATDGQGDTQDSTDSSTTDTSTTDSTDSTDTQTNTNDNSGKGAAVSQLAHQTPPAGETKGQVVCTYASAGKCKAGQNGQSDATTHGKAGQSHGQSDATTHGQSSATTHGKAGLTHGQSTLTVHGKAGAAHGNASQSHGQAASHS